MYFVLESVHLIVCLWNKCCRLLTDRTVVSLIADQFSHFSCLQALVPVGVAVDSSVNFARSLAETAPS